VQQGGELTSCCADPLGLILNHFEGLQQILTLIAAGVAAIALRRRQKCVNTLPAAVNLIDGF
jgi:hypothetical protein